MARAFITYNQPLGQSWTCPAGVFNVTVQALRNPWQMSLSMNNNLLGAAIAQAPIALDAQGNAWQWGLASTSQPLGTGSQASTSTPVQVLEGLQFKEVLAGGASANDGVFGLTAQGNLYGWGINTFGQLGIGSVASTSSPVAVLGGFKFYKVFGCIGATFGLTTNGTLYGWGGNGSGILGIGNVTSQSSPVAVLGGFTFASLSLVSATGTAGVIGLTTAGVAYGWGGNSNGCLGIGNVTVQSSPVAVLGSLTFQKIIPAAQGNNGTSGLCCLGLTTAGALYGWGNNQYGVLGAGLNPGTTLAVSSPVAVLGGLTFVWAWTDGLSAFGITAAGKAYSWGFNLDGELAQGNVTSCSSPIAILGGFTWQAIWAANGNSNWFGLTTAGTLYAWGANQSGGLGLGNVTPQSSPVAVLGGLTFATIFPSVTATSGIPAVIALSSGGALYGWGVNGNGQLGVGNTTSRSSPVAVLGGFQLNYTPMIGNAEITVVPGTSYAINFIGYGGYFGSTMVAPGIITQMQVQYDQ